MNINSPIYQGFVLTTLCKQLYEAGLTPHVTHHYRIVHGKTTLNSYVFDQDDYYADGDSLMDKMNKPTVIPAYSIKDIEKILPGTYMLHRNERGYTLMLEDIYGLPSQTADRLPDVFAQMVLAGLQRNVIKLEAANSYLTAL